MLRFALPSKGEMEEPTLRFLEGCGLRVNRSNPRQYSATIRGVPGVSVIFQRAPDIPNKVDEGSADIGITGFDALCEERSDDDNLVVLMDKLGYSHADLVLAVPEAWIDVNSIADLAELAIDFRERSRPLRVVTKFPRLTQAFFFEKDLTHFTLVESKGALEAAPMMGYADMISDLTSTGTTLRENRLKMIAGGTIVKSEACLIGNRRRLKSDPAKLEAVRVILELIEASQRAKTVSRLTANIRAGSAEEVARQIMTRPDLAGLQGPTVSPVFSKEGDRGGWYSATIVVESSQMLPAVEHLRSIGASGVTVSPTSYVFAAESDTYRALLRKLGIAREAEVASV